MTDSLTMVFAEKYLAMPGFSSYPIKTSRFFSFLIPSPFLDLIHGCFTFVYTTYEQIKLNILHLIRYGDFRCGLQ